MSNILFGVAVVILLGALSGAVWSAAVPEKLVFVVAPLAEEPWLEEQYGEKYREYRGRVRRFL